MIKKTIEIHSVAAGEVPEESKVVVLGWGENSSLGLKFWLKRKNTFSNWPATAMFEAVEFWCYPADLGWKHDYTGHFLLEGK